MSKVPPSMSSFRSVASYPIYVLFMLTGLRLQIRMTLQAVATRNGPRWVQKYRTDCSSCNVSVAASLGALVAAPGDTAYYKQTAARELLAGKLRWPGGATMDIVKTMSTNIDLLPVWSDTFDDLINDIIDLGVQEACDNALQRIAMITVNHENRKAGISRGSNGGGDAEQEDDGADGGADGDGGNGGGAAAATEAAAVSESPGKPVGRLLEFIEGNVAALELELKNQEVLDGWDGADGWFVLDDDFASVRPCWHACLTTSILFLQNASVLLQ